MATVACKCGEKFHPSPEHYGKDVKCRRCGRTVTLTPDPAFDPPPPPRNAGFTQTFTNPPPQPPRYSYAPPPYQPPPPPQESDPNAPPPGLHPEIRRILLYSFIVAAILAVVLIASVFKSSPSPSAAPVDVPACC